jgi:hypothetical protein
MRARPEQPSADPHARAFTKGRARALVRLERAGLTQRQAYAWLTAWELSTAGLDDFRRSSDFWELGFQFAREEHRRGHPTPNITRSLLEHREAS